MATSTCRRLAAGALARHAAARSSRTRFGRRQSATLSVFVRVCPVRQDGAVVPASGYSLSGTRLEFTGSYCDNIQAGLVSSIRVSDGC